MKNSGQIICAKEIFFFNKFIEKKNKKIFLNNIFQKKLLEKRKRKILGI